MTLSKLIDNSSDSFSLKKRLSELFYSEKYTEISIATGYWDLPSIVDLFAELEAFLERGNTTFRLLIGEEPTVASYQVRNKEIQNPAFPQRYIKRDLEDLDLLPEFQKAANLISKFTKENAGVCQFQIRIYRKNFLHAKCYIAGSQNENAVGIIGSSNFTRKGLSGNLELNQYEDNNATVNFIRKNDSQHPSHRSWFEDIWNDSEEWTREFREELLEISKHGSLCFSPYEMYIHALYRIFQQDLMDELNEVVSNDPDPSKPQLLKFQVQNANSIIRKLERQGVAMLSDSVGLGKTYTALKVVDYYKNSPEKGQRVVIICPAGLIPQWKTAFNDFGILPPEILSMQNVEEIKSSKSLLQNIPVGLFVFDESHNMRSGAGQRFQAFIEWRMANPNAKTLLVTATPINNQLTDLTNQVNMALGGEVVKLGKFYDKQRQRYDTIEERLKLIRLNIQRQIRETGAVNYEHLKDQLRPMLNKFIVRRTRQGIENEYPDGLLINGKLEKFPEARPFNLEYQLQNEFKNPLLELATPFPALKDAYLSRIESLLELDYFAHPLDLLHHTEKREKAIASSLEIIYSGILSLGFPCYRYNIYQWRFYGQRISEMELNVDENRELSRQTGIYGIFRTIFLKRLESSLHSIWLSLNNYEGKLLQFQDKLNTINKIVSVKDIARLNELIALYNEQSSDEDELDFDIPEFETDKKINLIDADPAVFRIDILKADIEKDLQIIAVLRQQVSKLMENDNKLIQLANKLDELSDQKVLVFTYFADTLKYLNDKLPSLLRQKRNIEFALGNKNEIENFACRFAPLSKKYEIKSNEKEIDVLCATDKLSEGQNLQDCGIIINYDLHWNPVRMIQRNGRINRLGTKHKEISIYNFRPTEQLESYLLLIRKLQAKIDLIRYTIGSDQSVLDEEPMPQDFTEDLYSRDEKKRIAALKKIHETSELIGAEDIHMDNLRAFNNNATFDESYQKSIYEMPRGKWGKISMPKPDDEFAHIAHVSDQSGEAGYFVSLSEAGESVVLSTEEGLNYIQTGSDDNKRFKDVFTNKPLHEGRFRETLPEITISNPEREPYNESQVAVISEIFVKMEEYGFPEVQIQQVYAILYSSENIYVNKEMMKLVRETGRLLRNGKSISSELLDRFVQKSGLTAANVENERPPLTEILQIFVR